MGYKKITSLAKEKYLMIHADDGGLSHSQNRAIMQSLQEGVVNSYSIMPPCPWFYEMALFAAKHPQYDCGIHLTLTCEWNRYKFGPVLSSHEVPSLVDSHGNFPTSRAAVKNNANPHEVKKELTAQIEKSLAMGIKPTHLDSHMYTLGLSPELLSVYKQLGQAYDLPIYLDKEFLIELGIDVEQSLSPSDVCVSASHLGEYHHFENNDLINYYNQTLDELKPGFNILYVHPAFDDEEMKGICVDHPNFGSRWRQVDFDFLNSDNTRLKLKSNNIHMITWSDIG